MIFLLIILFATFIYIITVLLICIDRYRFFSGGKIKDYFNEEYYGDSLYSNEITKIATFMPFMNVLFAFIRCIYLFVELIKWILTKIGVTKWYNHFINLDLKK